jgi:glucose/arabinose dehydrogenase
MEFGSDGYLYVTVGERGKQDEFPQVLDKAHGKVHRITESGDIPADNPFFNQAGAVQSIWSYGHRNPQGLAFNPVTGDLWEHEHGPRGGDELNVVQPGKNYGWPVVSYGTHYDGRSFTEKTAMDGIESPVTYWVPSIAPCGMAFVTGDRYPAWKGNLLVGSLSFRFVNRCVLDGRKVVKQENLFNDVGRVRAITMGRDGYIYFSVENPGYIFRVVPVK